MPDMRRHLPRGPNLFAGYKCERRSPLNNARVDGSRNPPGRPTYPWTLTPLFHLLGEGILDRKEVQGEHNGLQGR